LNNTGLLAFQIQDKGLKFFSFGEGESRFVPKDADRCSVTVRFCGGLGDHGDLHAMGKAVPGAGINDMRITLAIDFNKLFSVAGGRESLVLQVDGAGVNVSKLVNVTD